MQMHANAQLLKKLHRTCKASWTHANRVPHLANNRYYGHNISACFAFIILVALIAFSFPHLGIMICILYSMVY